ncbi:multidrug effflux MFS transporter [Tistrella bauzanensis]|uniref:Bcr/CflA family efflux transporter n=1 Tax=Tistrella arctica TaxID=3133430 RepID=A0ABU9YI09_9PROT
MPRSDPPDEMRATLGPAGTSAAQATAKATPPPPGAPRGLDAPLWILVVITAIGPVALNLFVPSMPAAQRMLAISDAAIQLTLTLYLVALAGAQLIYGPVSDRFGRRPPLIAGLVFLALGSVVAATADSATQLVLGRVLQAAGGCAGLVLGRAMIRDRHDPSEAASRIATVTLAMMLAPMLTPAVGGYADQFLGWRAGFWIIAGIGGAIFAAVALKLPETHHDRRPMPGIAPMINAYRNLLRDPAFLGHAGAAGFGTAAFFAFVAGAPHVIIELMGRTPGEFGLWYIIASGGYMLGNIITARLASRAGPMRMVVAGSAAAVLGYGAMVVCTLLLPMVPPTVFLPMTMIAFANGIILPNATAGALSAAGMASVGAAAGLAGFLQMGSGAVASQVIGWTRGTDTWPLVWVMVGCGIGTVSCTLLAWRAERARRG